MFNFLMNSSNERKKNFERQPVRAAISILRGKYRTNKEKEQSLTGIMNVI